MLGIVGTGSSERQWKSVVKVSRGLFPRVPRSSQKPTATSIQGWMPGRKGRKHNKSLQLSAWMQAVEGECRPRNRRMIG
jgi:hypothetical protein